MDCYIVAHLSSISSHRLAMSCFYFFHYQEEKKEKQIEGVPDEEGFIKVTRHGKNRGGRRTEETERKGHEHIRSRRKKNVSCHLFLRAYF